MLQCARLAQDRLIHLPPLGGDAEVERGILGAPEQRSWQGHDARGRALQGGQVRGHQHRTPGVARHALAAQLLLDRLPQPHRQMHARSLRRPRSLGRGFLGPAQQISSERGRHLKQMISLARQVISPVPK